MPEDTRVDDEVARLALAQYDFSPDVQLRMINLSENATYLVEDAATARDGVLRVHRKDYHTLGLPQRQPAAPGGDAQRHG